MTSIFNNALDELSELGVAFERRNLEQLLAITHGNVSKAAVIADRPRTDMYRLFAKCGLDPPAFKR